MQHAPLRLQPFSHSLNMSNLSVTVNLLLRAIAGFYMTPIIMHHAISRSRHYRNYPNGTHQQPGADPLRLPSPSPPSRPAGSARATREPFELASCNRCGTDAAFWASFKRVLSVPGSSRAELAPCSPKGSTCREGPKQDLCWNVVSRILDAQRHR